MKKVYIILSSWGKHDSYKKPECVVTNFYSAEYKKAELENKYKIEIPFPFNWCTEKEFEDIQNRGKSTSHDDDIFNDWWDKEYRRKEFNCCIIEEVDFYEQKTANK